MAASVDASIGHVMARLAVLEMRVRAAVARRRVAEPAHSREPLPRPVPRRRRRRSHPRDQPAPRRRRPGSGDLLRRVEAAGDEAEVRGERLRLRELARAFGLDQIDVDVLLGTLRARRGRTLRTSLCVPARRREPPPCVDRARARACRRVHVLGGSARPLAASAPLCRGVARRGRRAVASVPLAGIAGPGSCDRTPARERRGRRHARVDPCAPAITGPTGLALRETLLSGARLVYLHDRTGAAEPAAVARALEELGTPALTVDLERVADETDPAADAGYRSEKRDCRVACSLPVRSTH